MVSMIVYRSVSRDVRRFIFWTSIRLTPTVSQITRYNAIDLSVRTPLGRVLLQVMLI